MSAQPAEALAALAAVETVAPRTPTAGATAPQAPPATDRAPLFSTIEGEYVEMRTDAGADRATLSTIRLRAGLFRQLMGDKPFDAWPKDLQDYVNRLQMFHLGSFN